MRPLVAIITVLASLAPFLPLAPLASSARAGVDTTPTPTDLPTPISTGDMTPTATDLPTPIPTGDETPTPTNFPTPRESCTPGCFDPTSTPGLPTPTSTMLTPTRTPTPGLTPLPKLVAVTCDVDRKAFKDGAKKQTEVTFRLWDAETGGTQCGDDYILPMDQLVVRKLVTDRFGTEKARSFARIEVILGSTASPITFCEDDTWIDVAVDGVTLTCDFSAKSPHARRLFRTSR